MKKLLLLSLLSTSVYADVFDFKITQQNFYCKPLKTCKIYTDFDVMIVNETNKKEHYDIGYNLQITHPSSAYNKEAHIDIKPRGTFRKHYHLDWPMFALEESNSYLLTSGIIIGGHPETKQSKTTTIWVY